MIHEWMDGWMDLEEGFRECNWGGKVGGWVGGWMGVRK